MRRRKPARVEHTAWVLVDNRHTAHRFVDGELAIDAGDVGFARYTRFGLPAPRWQLGADVDGERAAVADRLACARDAARERAGGDRRSSILRVHGDAKQR